MVQIFLIRMNQYPVIHVPYIVLDPKLLLDQPIQRIKIIASNPHHSDRLPLETVSGIRTNRDSHQG
jgi:hypothetical protein